MKSIFLSAGLRRLKAKPKLMRKVLILATIAFAGVILTTAMAVWVGASAIGYVASAANQVVQSPVTQGHLEDLKMKLAELPIIQGAHCWSKAQTLLAIQPWLEREARDNLVSLKVACFKQHPGVCEAGQCEQIRELNNKAEGSFL